MEFGVVRSRQGYSLLDAAWAAGIRYVDTAPGYWDGQAYRHLAAWQATAGHRFRVVVKPGRPIRGGVPVSRLDLEGLYAEVDEAAAVLGPPDTILIKDPPALYFSGHQLADLMDQLANRYQAARIGLTSHRLAECSLLPQVSEPRTAVIEYNGLNWWSAAPLADELHRKGWMVWSMQPLANGFLGGRCSRGREFLPSIDWRRRISLGDWEVRNRAAKAFLTGFTQLFPGISPAVLAIAFCLSDRHVERITIGPKRVAQLDDFVAALSLAETADFRRVADARRRLISTSMNQ
jgi:aryl-alcohol dehydrogenase-like predicted oxidoreductase